MELGVRDTFDEFEEASVFGFEAFVEFLGDLVDDAGVESVGHVEETDGQIFFEGDGEVVELLEEKFGDFLVD